MNEEFSGSNVEITFIVPTGENLENGIYSYCKTNKLPLLCKNDFETTNAEKHGVKPITFYDINNGIMRGKIVTDFRANYLKEVITRSGCSYQYD